MPFIRKGLCATDQRICARLLSQGVHPQAIAQRLKTTVDYVEKFTTKALDESLARRKKREATVIKHAGDTRKTAAALAGAAKEILSAVPVDTEDEDDF